MINDIILTNFKKQKNQLKITKKKFVKFNSKIFELNLNNNLKF